MILSMGGPGQASLEDAPTSSVAVNADGLTAATGAAQAHAQPVTPTIELGTLVGRYVASTSTGLPRRARCVVHAFLYSRAP